MSKIAFKETDRQTYVFYLHGICTGSSVDWDLNKKKSLKMEQSFKSSAWSALTETKHSILKLRQVNGVSMDLKLYKL